MKNLSKYWWEIHLGKIVPSTFIKFLNFLSCSVKLCYENLRWIDEFNTSEAVKIHKFINVEAWPAFIVAPWENHGSESTSIEVGLSAGFGESNFSKILFTPFV